MGVLIESGGLRENPAIKKQGRHLLGTEEYLLYRERQKIL